MELKQIRYFELVCRYKSISKAADKLYLSQQAVSKQISNLEKELGIRLFVRNNQGVELTEEGSYLYDQALKLLEIQKETASHFALLQEGDRDALKIGVSHGLEAFFDEGFFRGFTELHDSSPVEVLSMWNPLMDDSILRDDIDAGFTLAPVRQQGLCLASVLRMPLWCIVNADHPLACRESVNLDDILDYPIAIADENYNSFYGFAELCERKNRKPDVAKMFDLISIYDYVARHAGAVGFTLDIYRETIRYPDIRYLPLNDPDASWNVCLAWKKEKSSPRTEALLSYARKVFRRYAP